MKGREGKKTGRKTERWKEEESKKNKQCLEVVSLCGLVPNVGTQRPQGGKEWKGHPV